MDPTYLRGAPHLEDSSVLDAHERIAVRVPTNNGCFDYLTTTTNPLVFRHTTLFLFVLLQFLTSVFLGLGGKVDVRDLIGHDGHELDFGNASNECNSLRVVPGCPSERCAAA